MKTRLKYIASKIDFWNLFIGIVIGFVLGVIFMNALIPSASQLIRTYRLDQKSLSEDRMMQKSANPYMMGAITSEKQFLEEMVKHHEAALVMARQVLTVNPRTEIKKLANDIISAQTTEIKIMKDWLASWK